MIGVLLDGRLSTLADDSLMLDDAVDVTIPRRARSFVYFDLDLIFNFCKISLILNQSVTFLKINDFLRSLH